MGKTYRNTRLRVAWPEIIALLVFGMLLLGACWEYHSYVRLGNVFNIAKTKVDYVIHAPSFAQVEQIRQLDHVARITPYYYQNIEAPVLGNLYIINNEDDLSYTPFSNELLLQKAGNVEGNKLYISDDFAKKSGWRIGKTVELGVGTERIRFNVASIYKTDNRQVGGLLIAIKSADIVAAMKNAAYSGAFISSKNRAISDIYFQKEYKPSYFSAEKEMPSETFVTREYLQDKTKHYAEQVTHFLWSWIGFLVFAYVLLVVEVCWRAKNYLAKWVRVDLADNFTVNQEISMYKRYFINMFLLSLLMQLGVYFVGRTQTVLWITNFNLIHLSLSVAVFGLLVVYWTWQLKTKFSKKQTTN
ncbi:hypothetical protein [Candidatus Avelusimicrobium fimicolum]|uniref:hypothetical protein n=1 Tax=Candidatus Avelusimicrobium fimicolum TaxID=3416216 RepID=UPI003D0F803B